MLNMKKGCRVPFPEKLYESYEKNENNILANVNAQKIRSVLAHFISMHADEPLFLILEIPTNAGEETEPGKRHKDVYYIDGLTGEQASEILTRYGELLINDGMCCFGFGCHISGEEIMSCAYNVLTVYSADTDKYDDFFAEHDIGRVDHVITAWDTFSPENYGFSGRIFVDGMDIYSLPDELADMGIYFAERREE